METGPRISQPEKAPDYIEVEVLPPEGKAKQSNDPDPFIRFVSRLLDTFFCDSGNAYSLWIRADHRTDSDPG